MLTEITKDSWGGELGRLKDEASFIRTGLDGEKK